MSTHRGEAVSISRASFGLWVQPNRLRDNSHFRGILKRINDGIVVGFVAEGESRGDQGSSRAQDLEESPNYAVSAAFDVAEGPHRRVHQHNLARLETDPSKSLLDLRLGKALLARIRSRVHSSTPAKDEKH